MANRWGHLVARPRDSRFPQGPVTLWRRTPRLWVPDVENRAEAVTGSGKGHLSTQRRTEAVERALKELRSSTCWEFRTA